MNNNRIAILAFVAVALSASVGCGQSNDDKQKAALGLGALSSSTPACGAVLGQSSTSLVWPDAPQTARIGYVGSLSSNANCARGSAPLRSLSYPKSVAVDAAGNAYIADRGGVSVFDTTSGKVRPFAPEVADARGIAAVDGKVYIVDNAQKKVLVYAQAGNLIGTIGGGELVNPQGAAWDKVNGRLYVTELTGALYGYSANGAQVFAATGLSMPSQVAVNSKGNVYVINNSAKRVMVYNAAGAVIGGWGSYGTAAGNFIRPKGIAIDSEDHVYVTDAAFDNFQIFDESGKLLLWVGQAGAKEGEFNLPGLIAIDSQDRIYVADFGMHRVQVFQYLSAN